MALNTKVALYGEPGSRKTLQVASLIREFGAENVGIVSCEQGLSTIASVIDEKNVYVANSLSDLRQAYAWAKDRYTKPEQWVVIDGGSRVFNWVSQDVWQNVNVALESILQGVSRKALPDNLKRYAAFITAKDEVDSARCWITVGSNSQYLIDAWIKLPSSLYMTFWSERPNVDQYTKGIQHNLDLPGKNTRDAVVGSFDFIFRLVSVDRDVSKAVCRTTSTSFAKCRDDRTIYDVPDEIEPFDLARFVRAVRGEAK